MIHIASRSNPHFKDLKLLANATKERRRQGRTLLDGPHLVTSYLDHGHRPVLVAVSEDALSRPEVGALLDRLVCCEVACFASSLFSSLAPVETPIGIMAVVEIPSASVDDPLGEFVVMLDGIQDPGNVGTIIRSAAAAGVTDVLLSAGCADAWAPRTLRAAMGGHFALSVRSGTDLGRAVADFPGKTVATVARDGLLPQTIDLRGSVAFVFGSEGAGLSPVLEQQADVRASIPMARSVESLSVGAAAAVILFERVRQLSAAGLQAR
jgi:RNA methyltransferase, TrmH family